MKNVFMIFRAVLQSARCLSELATYVFTSLLSDKYFTYFPTKRIS